MCCPSRVLIEPWVEKGRLQKPHLVDGSDEEKNPTTSPANKNGSNGSKSVAAGQALSTLSSGWSPFLNHCVASTVIAFFLYFMLVPFVLKTLIEGLLFQTSNQVYREAQKTSNFYHDIFCDVLCTAGYKR